MPLTIHNSIYMLLYMWTIYEKKPLLKSLKKIPLNIRKEYEVWKRVVEFQGTQGLREMKGYHDESLKGVWKGFRSSRLSLQWRVIYKSEKEEFEIYVIDINAHKYE
jgi:addiction module RelE/StbE family toxin